MPIAGFKARNHPQQMTIDEVDDRAVPQSVFNEWHVRFCFTIDVAASPANAKLPNFYDQKTNGLAQSWRKERVYCNPPFSHLEPWILKAWEETNARLIVMLLPSNRTEQPFWQNLVEPYRDRPGSPLRVEFMPHRIKFLKPGETVPAKGSRPIYGCCFLIWERLGPVIYA